MGTPRFLSNTFFVCNVVGTYYLSTLQIVLAFGKRKSLTVN